jgi:hypothetical protein
MDKIIPTLTHTEPGWKSMAPTMARATGTGIKSCMKVRVAQVVTRTRGVFPFADPWSVATFSRGNFRATI